MTSKSYAAILVAIALWLPAVLASLPSQPTPPAIKVKAPTPESITSQFKAEQKQKQYARAARQARWLFKSYGCNGELADSVGRSAVDLHLDVRVLTALIFVESTCRKNVISRVHGKEIAVGATQVNYRVWKKYTREQLLNPEINIAYGSEIFASYVRRYGLREGLHHYNGLGDAGDGYAMRVLTVAGYSVN